MSWGKSDDATAFHPRVLALASMKDERLLNEAWGFLHRAFCWSAQVYTDGFIPEAMISALAGGRGPVLVKAAQRARILGKRIPKHDETGMPGWPLLLDQDTLLHLITKAEKEAEQEYRAQLRNPHSFGPVRLRDGDQCRYCGVVVNWKDTTGKGGRRGTLDHITPGEPEMVVACITCNSSKQDKTPAAAGLTLQDPPDRPYFTKHTKELLERHGFTLPPTARTTRPTQVDPQPQPTPPDDPSPTDPDDLARTELEVDTQRTLARTTPLEQPQPLARTGTTGAAAPLVSTGRDQAQTRAGPAARAVPNQIPPGRVGTGQVGLGTPPSPSSVMAGSRGARGSRGRRKSRTNPPMPGAQS